MILSLVKKTHVRGDKPGAVDNNLPPTLLRLGIDPQYWCEAMQPRANHSFSRTLRCQDRLPAYAVKLEIGLIKRNNLCGNLFLSDNQAKILV